MFLAYIRVETLFRIAKMLYRELRAREPPGIVLVEMHYLQRRLDRLIIDARSGVSPITSHQARSCPRNNSSARKRVRSLDQVTKPLSRLRGGCCCVRRVLTRPPETSLTILVSMPRIPFRERSKHPD